MRLVLEWKKCRGRWSVVIESLRTTRLEGRWQTCLHLSLTLHVLSFNIGPTSHCNPFVDKILLIRSVRVIQDLLTDLLPFTFKFNIHLGNLSFCIFTIERHLGMKKVLQRQKIRLRFFYYF